MQRFCVLWYTAHGDGIISPYRLRCGRDANKPRYLVGAPVFYTPTKPEDMAIAHTYHSKCLEGVFMGYRQQLGWGLVRGLEDCSG